MKILQISDLHLKSGSGLLHGLDPSAHLAACVEDINIHHADAAFVVVSGDISDDGGAKSYLTARDLLSQIKRPLHFMVGNHDSRDEFKRAFPHAVCDENGFVQSTTSTRGRFFAFLDTVKASAHIGEFCVNRAQWLGARLKAARKGGKRAYIFAHHPPMRISVPYLDRLRLFDGGRLAETLAPHREIVRHLFFGHVHRTISGMWRGVPFSCVKGLNHQVALDMHGEQNPPYTPAPPAYAVILLNGDDVVVHHREFISEKVVDGLRETPPRRVVTGGRATALSPGKRRRGAGRLIAGRQTE